MHHIWSDWKFKLALKINQLRRLWQVHSVSFHCPPLSIHSAAQTNERTGKDLLCWTIQLLCQNIKRSQCTVVWVTLQSRKKYLPCRLKPLQAGKHTAWEGEPMRCRKFVHWSWGQFCFWRLIQVTADPSAERSTGGTWQLQWLYLFH